MPTLMIVDDEQPVVDGVCHILEQHRPELRIVATATSGMRAIELAEQFEPDIVFVDIMMPGIDGLDAFEQIKTDHPGVVGIVATAYERFDIAQRAVRLGVFDYILKPINRDRVLEAVDGAVRRVEQRGDRHGRTLSRLALLQQMAPAAEMLFVRSICRGEVLGDLIPLFGRQGADGATRWITTIAGFSERHDGRASRFENDLHYKWPCVVGRDTAKRCVAFIPVSGRLEAHARRGEIERFLECTSADYPGRFVYALGQAADLEELPSEYHHLVLELSGASRTSIDRADIESILAELRSGDEEAARELFFDLVSDTGDIDGESSRAAALSAILQLEITGSVRFSAVNDVDEVFAELLATTRRDGALDGAVDRASLPQALRHAIEWLEVHFPEPIQLADVAEVVRVSGPYLSQLFGRFLGKGFSDYLTTIRIEHAKALLGSPDISVKEVSHEVGYTDPNYFSRVFRRVTGYSPTTYLDDR